MKPAGIYSLDWEVDCWEEITKASNSPDMSAAGDMVDTIYGTELANAVSETIERKLGE